MERSLRVCSYLLHRGDKDVSTKEYVMSSTSTHDATAKRIWPINDEAFNGYCSYLASDDRTMGSFSCRRLLFFVLQLSRTAFEGVRERWWVEGEREVCECFTGERLGASFHAQLFAVGFFSVCPLSCVTFKPLYMHVVF